ncbi:MAG: FAD-binding oxidoreductase, partial [Nitratireductor sp.]|nr:FAD-binding oxidoreductase [Nitratireductor sp.]
MRVAVLGGGLQGCCLAIELADRGVDVTLIDRNDRLLTRAAAANEGKVHLGYMYASDPSLRTARTMLRGALAFGKIIGRQLGVAPETLAHSKPATYVVHRDSQRPPAEALDYLDAVHRLIGEEAGEASSYFGADIRQPLRRWSPSEVAASFNPEAILAAADTCEVAVDPVKLTDRLRKRVEETGRGNHPGRPWIHRLKYGVVVRGVADTAP